VATKREGAFGNFKQMVAAIHPADPGQVVREPILEGRHPVDCFRRKFSLPADAAKARLYITALGLYEAKIDGTKVGDWCMAPGHTDYRKRVQYQTCDVTKMLKAGSHEMTVQLADGWYRGSCGAWGLLNQYGTQTKLLAQLEISYEDGTSERIVTDGSWEWSDDGPILFADNKDGEIVDATRTPSYQGHVRLSSHEVTPSASNNVPVTMHERFVPKMQVAPNGRLLFDLGQNIAGWIELSFDAHAGQHVLIRCGEMLDAEGNLTLKNIQCTREGFATPLQQVEYVCREGRNFYRNTFCVFGFRYVEVETDAKIGEGDLFAPSRSILLWSAPDTSGAPMRCSTSSSRTRSGRPREMRSMCRLTARPASAMAGREMPRSSSRPSPISSAARPSNANGCMTSSMHRGRTERSRRLPRMAAWTPT
jgi:alpha-L-rhamnosidase